MLNRIYGLLSVVIVLAIGVTGWTAYGLMRSYHDQRSENQLLAATRFVQHQIGEGVDIESAAATAQRVFAEDAADMRLTIVERTGTVLFDNTTSAEGMDNHMYRPEIRHAFRTESRGSAIRRSDTLAEEMLYLALYDENEDTVIRAALPLAAHRAGLGSLWWTMGLLLLSSLLILLLTSLFSARIITRPLTRLKKASGLLAAGDYATRVPVMGQDDGEVAALSEAFNAMAENLENTVSDLADKNARLDAMLQAWHSPLLAVDANLAVRFMNESARELFDRDISLEKGVYPLLLITHHPETESLVHQAMQQGRSLAVELTLQTAKRDQQYKVIASPFQSPRSQGAILSFHNVGEARRLQKLRSDFVANVTHELKTPLTSIRGFIETLQEGAIENPKVAHRFLDIIDIEADRLHRLISDILALSEIEELSEDSDLEDFDLNALIEDVAVLLDESASEKKVNLYLPDSEKPLPVRANASRIKQVLINLVDNAIKYNREQGKVKIWAKRVDAGTVEIQVQDEGYGIAPEHQERVFERFYRVDQGRSRKLGGTGLGLSIVKHIAYLYSGEVSVESLPGEGSTFKVRLRI